MATLQERAARGKLARKRLPIQDLAACTGTVRDVVSLLRADDATRVPDLVPIRYGRMLASPFTYYRGSAGVMAADLADLPSTGLEAQLCGDAHLSNFGVYRSPERRLVFDINDFDETLPGPFEWDVKRLAASLVLAGRENGHELADRRRTVISAVESYRTAMREFAEQGNLAVWYARVDVEELMADLLPQVSRTQRKRSEAGLEKARRNDSLKAARKLTVTTDGQTRFLSRPPLQQPLSELLPDLEANALRNLLEGVLADYRETLVDDRRHLLDQFVLADLARRVVGVGSVGTRAWILLLTGRDQDDPLLLQAKEPGVSVLAPYLGESSYDNSGERVVAGQRLMQASSDIFLGWQRTTDADGVDHDYYVRQLRDGKASANVGEMRPRGLRMYGEICAWTLARAHARSGDRVAIASYLGKRDTFERALAEFAETYADLTSRQFQQLQAAAEDGRVAVTYGV